tara:strand:- start:96 stop:206 length:111 start_codon:yes stop_codon:yes gene_type:complete
MSEEKKVEKKEKKIKKAKVEVPVYTGNNHRARRLKR